MKITVYRVVGGVFDGGFVYNNGRLLSDGHREAVKPLAAVLDAATDAEQPNRTIAIKGIGRRNMMKSADFVMYEIEIG
jgi:hypothetical protein